MAVNVDATECDHTGTFEATATDNCGVASFAYSVGETTITYPYDFPVGTTSVLAVVTDDNGQTANCSFDVVVTDNIDPVITCPTTGLTVNVDADECDHTGTFEATATDNCGVASFAYSVGGCLLYTSPSPRDATLSRMPSSA